MAAAANLSSSDSEVTSSSAKDNQFPLMTPEGRLMNRGIAFPPLPGYYSSRPNVSGARAKVDTRNTSYNRYRSSKSAGCSEGDTTSTRSTKTSSSSSSSETARPGYNHVRSKTDCGQRRATITLGMNEKVRRRSKTESNTAELEAHFASAKRRLAQLQRSMAHQQTSIVSGGVASRGERSKNRKVFTAGEGRSSRIGLKVKSRIDCSDPHPEVTKLSHSVDELLVVSDSTRETINPRFLNHYPHARRRTSRNNNNSTQSKRRPVEEKESTTTSESEAKRKGRNRRPVREITSRRTQRKSEVPGSAPTSCHSGPTSLKTPSTDIVPDHRVSSDISSPVISSGRDKRDHTTSRVMEILTQSSMTTTGISHDPTTVGDGVVVKSKLSGSVVESADSNLIRYSFTPSNGGVTNEPSSVVVVGGGGEEEARDSVSSSEGVGVTPEYANMDVDTDAFSDSRPTPGSAWSEGDEIVGFEVSGDSTQTTVNLLHLLGHKNRPTEQIKTDYQESDLWVIGEEDEEEEEEEEEMEEEICLEEGAPGIILEVPQLFVVDENDAIVEKVKTGRRRQSKGSQSSESLTTSPPPLNDCTFGIHSLSIHH